MEYDYATDDEALEAFQKLARMEGIIPALESAHAIAEDEGRAEDGARPDHHRESLRPRRQGRGARRPSISSQSMRSMTGYGRGQSVQNGSKFSVELNSVNRKQSDVVVTLPRELAGTRSRASAMSSTPKSRAAGSTSSSPRITRAAAHAEASRSMPDLARTYYRAMVDLQKELNAAGEINIETILRAPGVLRVPEEQISVDDAWPHVESRARRKRSRDLIKMREREGKHLAKDLIQRLKIVRGCVRKIRQLQPGGAQAPPPDRCTSASRRRASNCRSMTSGWSRKSIFFADKSDISEELTRLESHFAQFAHHLRKNEPVGRTLEFMCQEIGREFNTLGAKANDVEISQLVVTCKAEMEKIREQIQNIE